MLNLKYHLALGWGICLVFAANPTSLSAALTPEKLYQRVLPSVMTLEVENQSGEKFIGSAVLALADDVAVTAWHVVANAQTVWAVFADGQRLKVIGCIHQDASRDLALLKLERPRPHGRATLCRELQAVAARIYVVGTPKGYAFSISDGLISQIQTVDGFREYQLSCPISPGNSGSPIFNQRGQVIGIASWTKSDAQNMSFAVPTQDFMRLNISGAATTWEQLAATNSPAPLVQLIKNRPGQNPASAAMADAGNFDAFQKWYYDSIGKFVTVVVQEAGRTNIFAFTVK
jgi:S1-C subfamily serine protease